MRSLSARLSSVAGLGMTVPRLVERIRVEKAHSLASVQRMGDDFR